MLRARGEHQQQLGIRGHRLIGRRQQQFADAFGQRRAARLAGQQRLAARRAQAFGEKFAVGGLAGAFRAFQGDEQAAHGVSLLRGAGLDR